MAYIMSGRGIDFLENWVNKNVTAADRKGSRDGQRIIAEKLSPLECKELLVNIQNPIW